MANFICVTCGVQFASTADPPQHCPVCEDERQFVNWGGQRWTTLAEMPATHANIVKSEGPDLYGIGTDPPFAIGQRALLVQLPGRNVLWDCISLIDDATFERVRALGGISAIAISHPHFYASMVEWSRSFGNIPIYLHAADRQWVMRPDPAIVFWEGETQALGGGITLIRCGGHFEGATVLHHAGGAQGRGVLLTSDTLQVAMDRRHVSFMRSYPNFIPLPPSVIRRVVGAVEPFAFDTIAGSFFGRHIPADAKAAVVQSAARYLRGISD